MCVRCGRLPFAPLRVGVCVWFAVCAVCLCVAFAVCRVCVCPCAFARVFARVCVLWACVLFAYMETKTAKSMKKLKQDKILP